MLMDTESYNAIVEQQKREIKNLKAMRESTRKEFAENIMKIIKERKNKSDIGTLTRIYRYCKNQTQQKRENITSVSNSSSCSSMHNLGSSVESNSKYKCGHRQKTIILKDSILSMTAYEGWVNSVGYMGDKTKCWDCYCKDSKPKLPKGFKKGKCKCGNTYGYCGMDIGYCVECLDKMEKQDG